MEDMMRRMLLEQLIWVAGCDGDGDGFYDQRIKVGAQCERPASIRWDPQ